MSDPGSAELWLRHLDGPPLDAAERARLAAALAADPAWRLACWTELGLHQRLAASLQLPKEDPDFVAAVERQCRLVGSTEEFVRKVGRGLPRTPSTRRQLRSRPRWPWWPLLAAAGLALALLALLVPRSASAPAGWQVAGAEGVDHAIGNTLGAGTRLTSRPGGRLLLTCDDMRVELLEAEALVPAGDIPAWRLERGTLTAEVGPRAGRPPFSVTSQHAVVEVLGTRFTVTVDERTSVTVERGRVRFGTTDSWRELGAGESGVLPPPPPSAPVGDARLALPSLFAYYRFDEGGGTTVRERTGRAPSLAIVEPAAAEWVADGLRLRSATHLLATGRVEALTDACVAAGAFSIEASFTPGGALPFAPATTGPARIVTLSEDSENRNATLGWGEIGLSEPALVLRVRQAAGASASNGVPAHWIPHATTRRTHVLVSYQAGIGARWFVDGREVATRTWDYRIRNAAPATGPLAAWSRRAQLALGGEVVPNARDGGLRPWLGTYHLVAFYTDAVDPATALRLTAEP